MLPRSLFAVGLVLALNFFVAVLTIEAQDNKSETDAEFERAFKLLTSKQYEPAAAAFLALAKRLEPGEQQATCYYNACCAYTLMGQLNRGLKLFAHAVQAGFRDVVHFGEDKDLDGLRKLPIFEKLVQLCREMRFNELDRLNLDVLEQWIDAHHGQLPPSASSGKPWIGVVVQTADSATRTLLNIEETGVVVQDVLKGSPAETGGIDKFDMIVRANDHPIADTAGFFSAIHGSRIGERTTVTVIRNGQRRTLTVIPIVEPVDRPLHELLPPRATTGSTIPNVPTPTPQRIPAMEKGYLGFRATAAEGGLKVVSVIDQSPAAAAGLQANDLIVRINDAVVATAADLRAVIVKSYVGDTLSVVVKRDGKDVTLKLTIGQKE